MKHYFYALSMAVILTGSAINANAQIGPAINEDFTATKSIGNWYSPTSGASVSDGSTGYITVTPGASGSKWRGDFSYKTTTGGNVTINPATYPIIAIKFTKPSTGNVIFDTNLGSYFKPGSGSSNNQYNADLSADNVYYYNLDSVDGNGNSAKLSNVNGTILLDALTHDTALTTFQFKIADLTTYQTYDIYWIKAFASVADLNAYVAETLPVTLTGFSVTKTSANTVVLKWNVASELNNNYFKIERKSAAGDYSQIATVASQGSGASSYSYTDNAAMSGENDYRLSQVDKDGNTKILAIKSINLSSLPASGLSVYPNPASGSVIHLKGIPGNANEVNATILTSAGTSIFKGTAVRQADGSYKINIGYKPVPGLYFVYVEGAGSQKVIFQ